MVEATSRYVRPVSYGDVITVSICVDEDIRYDGELGSEGRKVRIFALRDNPVYPWFFLRSTTSLLAMELP